MDQTTIKQAIVRRVESSEAAIYSDWTIGISQNPGNRKIEHKFDGKDISFWMQWVANSPEDAQAIESYFINQKAMKGGTGGDLVPGKITYVYIF